jgi:hypothetical protein
MQTINPTFIKKSILFESASKWFAKKKIDQTCCEYVLQGSHPYTNLDLENTALLLQTPKRISKSTRQFQTTLHQISQEHIP